MTVTQGNSYGFERAFVWRVNSSGIATGQLDPDSPGSAPLTSPAYEVGGPIEFTMPGANFGTFEFVGGGSYEGSADGGLQSLAEGSMQSSRLDAALAVLLAGGSVDTTTIAGGPKIWSPNMLNPSPNQVGLMLQTRLQSRDSATAGLNKYASIIFPLVQMRLIKGNPTQNAGTNPTPTTLSVKPQIATKLPWGVAFDSNQGWYNNSNIWYGINSDYPWHLVAFLQDNTETDTVLTYKPIYDTVTNGNTNSVHAVNGIVTAPSSITIGTATVAMSSAGTADQWRTHFYQTAFETP